MCLEKRIVLKTKSQGTRISEHLTEEGRLEEWGIMGSILGDLFNLEGVVSTV